MPTLAASFLFSLAVGAVPIKDDQISLRGIQVGDSPKSVRAKLGKPNRVELSQDFLNKHYYYADLVVSFSDDVVAGLETRGRTACTPMKLCPGDSLVKMRKLYGTPVADPQRGTFEYYPTEYSGCWLRISRAAEKVRAIEVACQP
jgi:hypothetical protein